MRSLHLGGGGIRTTQYDALVLPPRFAGRVPKSPKLQMFLDTHLEMQLGDVRTMLQLPRDAQVPGPLGQALQGSSLDLANGCNFATAAVLLNLVSGASVLLFEPERHRASRRAPRASLGPVALVWTGWRRQLTSGTRFRRFVLEYIPTTSNLSAKKCADVLYDWTRNPLVHSLGVDPWARKGRGISLAKGPLDEQAIAVLETSTTLPTWCTPIVEGDTKGNYVIGVPALHWGLHRAFDIILADDVLCASVERLL